MILSEEQIKEFNKLAKPLSDFLKENFDMYTEARIKCNRVEIFDKMCSQPVDR